MKSLLQYLLACNIGLCLFLIVYWIGLRNENQFGFKRAYLLLAIISSFLFPLLQFSIAAPIQVIPQVDQIIPTQWLPELIITEQSSINTGEVPPTITVFEMIYWGGACLFLAILVIRIVSLHRFFSKQLAYTWRNFKVVESDEAMPTFSFFHYIFIGRAKQYNLQEKEAILEHESTHAKQGHTIDILLVNMAHVVCWFNPILLIYKKALVQLHEFEADARSVENTDVEQYCSLLAKVALQSAQFPIANHFHNSLTIKRISMMKTLKRKIPVSKIIYTLTVIPIFLLAVACHDQIKENATSGIKVEQLPAEAKKQLAELQKGNPSSTYVILKSGEETHEKLEAYSKQADFGTVSVSPQTEDGSFVFVEFNKRYERIKSLPKDESAVFSQVDEMAAPLFGMDNFYRNIAYTLKYPLEARQKGIEGKVFIEFVINTDGSTTDYKVLRSLDEALDTEAMRTLIQLDTKWRPAIHQDKIVRMKMVMPIVYKLDGSEEKADDSRVDNSLEEVVAVGKKAK
ncbi:MAG: TonB family protein [Bacteroidetes bacterium]|nr:TonB family protein [Bacteroidota bacterium]